MNGVHDMGGMHGFGAIPNIDDIEPFHHDWERRIFGINFASGGLGLWNIDMVRSEMEATPPDEYLHGDNYFRRFVLRLERLMLKHGLATSDEIKSGKAFYTPRPGMVALLPEKIPALVSKGSSSMRPATSEPRFKNGDHVRARVINPKTHTRLPRYVRGHCGVITINHGVHVFPDSNVLGNEDPQWVYAVRFDGRDVWGEESEPGCEIVIDAFEPCLAKV